jgi:phage terminase large subunit-like protein
LAAALADDPLPQCAPCPEFYALTLPGIPREVLSPERIRQFAYSFTSDQANDLRYRWRLWARPEQLMPPGEWRTWLIMSGRGFGKTRAMAEAMRELVMRKSKQTFALIAPTAADCRDVMIEGESGLLNVFPPWERPVYEPSKRKVTFRNGSVAIAYSAEEPERLRGPQHHGAFCDEIAVYPNPRILWDNLKFGLRLGDDPRIVAATTPRPSPFLRDLIADAGTVMTRGSTFANRANLPASTLKDFERIYGGTRIGRQELEGELLEEAEGALWRRVQIEELRVRWVPDMQRVVVAIDPATTSGPSSDETGIVICGLGVDGHGYVLRDLSCKLPPDQWAARAVSGFDAMGADKIIAETNNGGDMIQLLLQTVRRNIPYEKITATRGKVVRAEPVAALYEQGKVHHTGVFKELEDEMANFVPGGLTKSPNRADALVWALSYLMLRPSREGRALSL